MNDISLLELRRVRWLLGFVAGGLFLSGVTVFPALYELRWLTSLKSVQVVPTLHAWLLTCVAGLEVTARDHSFLLYAGDWLAFAHIMLAVLFVGAIHDPLRNIWVVKFGLICCAALIPLALICGPLRGVPFFWRIIDCAFAPMAGIPLWMAYRNLCDISSKYQGS